MPGPTGDCCGSSADGLNAGCGLVTAHSKSLAGPWEVAPLNITDQWRSERLYCTHTNPAPAVLPNGTVVLAFNAGYCNGGLETIGLATAPHWSGPYTLLDPAPVLGCDASPHKSEDPFLWKSGRGWHLLVHNQQGPEGVSAYAYSPDARNWTLSPNTPYTTRVDYADGTSETLGRCERPQLLFGADGAPTYLINGAEPRGGHSFTLLRPLKQP